MAEASLIILLPLVVLLLVMGDQLLSFTRSTSFWTRDSVTGGTKTSYAPTPANDDDGS